MFGPYDERERSLRQDRSASQNLSINFSGGFRMGKNFKVKTLFEGQFHERYQFSLDMKGNNYGGIFNDGEIQWFHPQPNMKLEDNHVEELESKVHSLITTHLG